MKKDKPKPKPFPQSADELMDLSDWLEIIDPGGWSSPEDEGKRSGILEHELSQEYWLNQYDNYIGQGGTLTFPQFMQQQINNKISKQINERAIGKKRIEGLASLLAVRDFNS